MRPKAPSSVCLQSRTTDLQKLASTSCGIESSSAGARDVMSFLRARWLQVGTRDAKISFQAGDLRSLHGAALQRPRQLLIRHVQEVDSPTTVPNAPRLPCIIG